MSERLFATDLPIRLCVLTEGRNGGVAMGYILAVGLEVNIQQMFERLSTYRWKQACVTVLHLTKDIPGEFAVGIAIRFFPRRSVDRSVYQARVAAGTVVAGQFGRVALTYELAKWRDNGPKADAWHHGGGARHDSQSSLSGKSDVGRLPPRWPIGVDILIVPVGVKGIQYSIPTLTAMDRRGCSVVVPSHQKSCLAKCQSPLSYHDPHLQMLPALKHSDPAYAGICHR
jgi:hypothetical protein